MTSNLTHHQTDQVVPLLFYNRFQAIEDEVTIDDRISRLNTRRSQKRPRKLQRRARTQSVRGHQISPRRTTRQVKNMALNIDSVIQDELEKLENQEQKAEAASQPAEA